MKTSIKKNLVKNWYLMDARDQVLGRLATRISTILMGKDKTYFSKDSDTGDFIVLINADKVRLTGKKLIQKYHQYHSGYPGGFKSIRYDKLMQQHPERVVRYAVRGMLPRNRLGDSMLNKLKVYRDEKHPHEAQNPIVINL